MTQETILPSHSSKVILHDNIVEKSGPSARAELEWYQKCVRHGFRNVPKTLGLIYDKDEAQDTIGMEFVQNVPWTSVSSEELFDEIVSTLDRLRKIPTYIADREAATLTDEMSRAIAEHPDLFDEKALNKIMMDIVENGNSAEAFAMAHSFSHGDFVVDNLLWSYEKGLVLIDPRVDIQRYSSYLMDVAALAASIEVGVVTGKWDAIDSAFYLSIESLLLKKYDTPILKDLIVYFLVIDASRDEKNAWNIAQILKEYVK